MARNFTPTLNLPTRRQKGLQKLFSGNAGCGIPAPFYYTKSEVREGQPMKFGATADLIDPCTGADGASCCGLVMQDTYSEANWAPEVRGYHMSNSTKQRLDGQPIGLLMGAGFATTTNYTGEVAWGDQAYVGPSGYLATTGDPDDKLPVIFEEAGEDGSPVRIRFDFPVVA